MQLEVPTTTGIPQSTTMIGKISQANISPTTAMGANLVPGQGATFKVWAPRASAVYLIGTFDGQQVGKSAGSELENTDGYWTGYLATAQEGDIYSFWVDGAANSGPKRDPYARQLAYDEKFPECSCIIRSGSSYPWHDQAFFTPDFSNMIVYQIHIGTYAVRTPGTASTFLDVIGKIPYLVALGINVLQPLPTDEAENNPSMGYNGADLYSPDFPYIETDPAKLASHLAAINGLLDAKGASKLTLKDITPGPAQLKCLVDLCHLHGIAVVLDVVYNHGGGFWGDDHCLYFWDRAVKQSENDSLYFTDKDKGTGGLSFALWNNDVRQFLINNAKYYIDEFHVDGFRYDEISNLIDMNCASGWSFCCDLTNTLRYLKPRLLQNAEFWGNEVTNYPASMETILKPTAWGGAGFDVLQHDGLREKVRNAVRAASAGRDAFVDFDAIAYHMYPYNCSHGWQAVTCVENHDIVKVGREERLPMLADRNDRRSWYARSRARFATGLLLTVPGIPQLFMGQEFLEDKQWDWNPQAGNLIWWDGLVSGSDKAMVDHLRFTQDLIRLRWIHAALRGDLIRPFHHHNVNRVIGFHRWLEGTGEDIIIAATLSESTWWNYEIGFPYTGRWVEVFNSDVYDHWVNPITAGNGGAVYAYGPPLDGFATSASVVIPANGFVVFARQ